MTNGHLMANGLCTMYTGILLVVAAPHDIMIIMSQRAQKQYIQYTVYCHKTNNNINIKKQYETTIYTVENM